MRVKDFIKALFLFLWIPFFSHGQNFNSVSRKSVKYAPLVIIDTSDTKTKIKAANDIRLLNVLKEINLELRNFLPSHIIFGLELRPIHISLSENLNSEGLFLDISPDHVYIHPRTLLKLSLHDLLLHEIFHALHLRINPGEQNWVKELLAQSFPYLILGRYTGYGIIDVLQNHNTPLLMKYNHEDLDASWYGLSLLFGKYILRMCTTNSKDLFLRWSGFTMSDCAKPLSSQGFPRLIEILNEEHEFYPQLPTSCLSEEKLFQSFAIALAMNRAGGAKHNPYFVISTSTRPQSENIVRELRAWNFQILSIPPNEDKNLWVNNTLRSWEIGSKKHISAFALNEAYPYTPIELSTNSPLVLPQTVSRIIGIRTFDN